MFFKNDKELKIVNKIFNKTYVIAKKAASPIPIPDLWEAKGQTENDVLIKNKL